LLVFHAFPGNRGKLRQTSVSIAGGRDEILVRETCENEARPIITQRHMAELKYSTEKWAENVNIRINSFCVD
jgi:hypothetical protein